MVEKLIKRYIILPAFEFSGKVLSAGPLATTGSMSIERGPGQPQDIRVLDSIGHDGPKLVETTEAGELALRLEYGPEIQVVPLTEYELPRRFAHLTSNTLDAELTLEELKTGNFANVIIHCVRRSIGLPGARVVCFTNFDKREGFEGFSDRNGEVFLPMPSTTVFERVYVFPPSGYWGKFHSLIRLPAGSKILLEPIDLSDKRHIIPTIYGDIPISSGEGVTVGIIDTGIDSSHPALNVTGGRNCVFDEIRHDRDAQLNYGDIDRHGTHVAGIVGSRLGVRGVAPGVSLRAYRVFGKTDTKLSASNFDITRAIDHAMKDGCDIINLSLGSAQSDPSTRKAVEEAAKQGVLIVAAAGNDHLGSVRFPAALEHVHAVSAVGHGQCYPVDSLEVGDRSSHRSPYFPEIFRASFTNIGPQVKFTAPGVGICSTVPANGYGVMSGTSQAAPVISGYAAHLLSSLPDLHTVRTTERRNRLITALYASAIPLGLGRDVEGFGLPMPIGAKSHL